MLEAIKLTKRYNGAAALDSLDLKIEPGEVFCLLGANGAGKRRRILMILEFPYLNLIIYRREIPVIGPTLFGDSA